MFIVWNTLWRCYFFSIKKVTKYLLTQGSYVRSLYSESIVKVKGREVYGHYCLQFGQICYFKLANQINKVVWHKILIHINKIKL